MIMLGIYKKDFYGRELFLLTQLFTMNSRFCKIFFILTMFGIYENNGADDHIDQMRKITKIIPF